MFLSFFFYKLFLKFLTYSVVKKQYWFQQIPVTQIKGWVIKIQKGIEKFSNCSQEPKYIVDLVWAVFGSFGSYPTVSVWSFQSIRVFFGPFRIARIELDSMVATWVVWFVWVVSNCFRVVVSVYSGFLWVVSGRPDRTWFYRGNTGRLGRRTWTWFYRGDMGRLGRFSGLQSSRLFSIYNRPGPRGSCL